MKTNLNEICSHLSEKTSKGMFLKRQKLQNNSNERKGKVEKERARRRKGGEEKKSNGCTLSFYNSYFGDSLWPKKNCSISKLRLDIYHNIFNESK